MAKLPAHKLRRRPGYFQPVALRSRHDGWSAERQCGFLAQLYLTGSVTAASKAVGMTAESAHRLRRREGAESFATAWDRVLAPLGSRHRAPLKIDYRKVTNSSVAVRVESGLVRPIVHRGRMVRIVAKHDNSTLLRLLRRLDAAAARAGPDADEGDYEVFKAAGSVCHRSPHRPPAGSAK
jgi:hypothetical protein